ncbi:DUF7019 family protein [Micromonospora sp. SL4-19]|uniref:DUF7019 family protein n=1 Tax=Micromonospora sp. SL4-19 TaxID=3399129 RepID=UPI003A4D4004
MSVRYYLYVSDSKIDMMLSQIDPALTRKRTTELSVNLPVLGGRRATESPAAGERTRRLERVVRHLEDHGDLGSVDDPGQFFWGLLPMRWGPFPSDPTLVYFAGSTPDTLVGLGGSGNHVLGAPPDPPAVPRSLTPSLLAALTTHPTIRALVEADADGDDQPDRAALAAVRQANAAMPGPAQNVEFVAKRLLHGPGAGTDGRAVLLGTPLYVALVD